MRYAALALALGQRPAHLQAADEGGFGAELLLNEGHSGLQEGRGRDCSASEKALSTRRTALELPHKRYGVGGLPIQETTPMNVLGISGSLRQGSYNTLALRAAQKLAPEGVTLQIADLADIPMYNGDLAKLGMPAAVARLKDQIAHADAVLIATPEYNFSVPGGLKNAIDWVSRPPEPPLDGKPVAILGASMGMLGTVRAQVHLRQILLFLNTFTLNKPEVFIGAAHTKFNAEGELTDEMTKKMIHDQLVALQALWKKVG
jgi:chromate reductase